MKESQLSVECGHTLDKLASQGLRRRLRTFVNGGLPTIVGGGREFLNLASNNYLGLANDARVLEAAKSAIDRYGLGAGSARLLSGNFEVHVELEAELASFHGTEAALTFAAGYTGNIAVLSALLGPRDTAFCDAYIHASLAEGCRVVHSSLRFYRHGDPEHLESLLRKAPLKGRRLIVTDGVFSMDADLAPLPDLVNIAERYNAILVVDDAHGVGTVGPKGRGTAAHFGLSDAVPVQIGTLSKAFGSQGGYVVGSRNLIDLILNKGRAFLHSTAAAPVLSASALAALRISVAEPQRRERLMANLNRLRSGFLAKGLGTLGEIDAPMTAVVFGEPQEAVRQSEKLEAVGIFAPAIRPPTVPSGTSRIRFAPMADHTDAEMDRVTQACG